MKTSIRVLSLIVAAAALITRAAGAQSLAIYGGAEAAGLGEYNGILGASLSSGLLGWHPIVGANVQTYRYHVGTPTVTKWAFVPSAGMQYRTREGAVQGTVGYAFVSGGDQPTQLGIGSTTGSTSGLVLGLQGNYWANNQEHQAIVSYNTRAEYLWSRARLARRINPGSRSVPVYLGGEVVYQGGNIKSLGTSQHRIQFGPTINFHLTPDFHLGGSAGYRTDDRQHIGTGYVRVEFVKLTSL